MAEQLERLRLADYMLDACGLPQMPNGARMLPLWRSLVYANTVTAGTYLPDEKQALQNDTFFIVSSISCVPQVGSRVFIRIQWPNGRYLTDQDELIQTGYRLGSSRRALGARILPDSMLRGVACPPGSSIRFTLNNLGTVDQAMVIIFHGCDLYWVGPGDSPPCCVNRL